MKQFLPIAFRLQVEQPGVSTIARHQFSMAAKFVDLALREHHDPVRHAPTNV